MISIIKSKISNLLIKYNKPINIMNGNFKNALISYITHPFNKKNKINHCNFLESFEMTNVLYDYGYNVDVIDYRSEYPIKYYKYDLVIGFGLPFINSFFYNKNIIKICYLTGANPSFSNESEAKRIKSLYERTGLILKPRREVYWPYFFCAINANAIILTGNNWTASTYASFENIVYTVPVPTINEIKKPAWVSDHRGFLWFGGGGAVHKGLDLVLEAARYGVDVFNVTVCGPILGEKDFILAYKKDLFESNNINFKGFVDVNSFEMNTLVNKNPFVILPSCSEGMASSVVTCMARGLIPIVTKETGISLENFGVEILEPSPGGVREAMEKAMKLTDDEISEQQERVVAYVRRNYTRISFKNAFANALNNIINN